MEGISTLSSSFACCSANSMARKVPVRPTPALSGGGRGGEGRGGEGRGGQGGGGGGGGVPFNVGRMFAKPLGDYCYKFVCLTWEHCN